MSHNVEGPGPNGAGTRSTNPTGTVDTAKHEAADLKDAASAEAHDVLDTAKQEAADVVGEAKKQARNLYAQTQREVREQATTQQQRIAEGLRSVGDELGSMAAASPGTGVAGDLVQQVSGRLSAASKWLGERDPSSVLNEVKRFARRKPGTFIVGAALVGVVAGRLTRALAANASDDSDSSLPPVSPPAQVHPDPSIPVPIASTGGDTTGAPLYAQTASKRVDTLGEASHDRPHAL